MSSPREVNREEGTGISNFHRPVKQRIISRGDWEWAGSGRKTRKVFLTERVINGMARYWGKTGTERFDTGFVNKGPSQAQSQGCDGHNPIGVGWAGDRRLKSPHYFSDAFTANPSLFKCPLAHRLYCTYSFNFNVCLWLLRHEYFLKAGTITDLSSA